MRDHTSHQISLCTTCQHMKGICAAGYGLVEALSTAIDLAGSSLGDDFEISGYSDLPQCPKTCLIGWKATSSHVYLFGDVGEKQDLDALVELAQSMTAPAGGWSKNKQGTERLSHTPVRVPAAMIVVELSKRKQAA